MSGVVMILRGLPDGGTTPYDGQYLAEFDHEAHGGIGSIRTTLKLNEARVFANFAEAMEFRAKVPKCKPLRHDGRPNRPLTATTWQISYVDSIRAGAL